MRNHYAAGRQLISALGQRGAVQDEFEKLRGIVREAKTMVMDLEWLVLLSNGDEKASQLWEKFTRSYCEANEALDELSYEAMRIHQMEEEIQMYCMMTTKVSINCSLSFHHPLLLLSKMSLRIKEFQHTIDEVKGEMKSLDATSSTRVENHESDSSQFISEIRDVENKQATRGLWMEVKKIVEMLVHQNNEEKLSVIPIILGWWDFSGHLTGVYMTRWILDDKLIEENYDLKICIDVASGFDVKCIVKQIIEQTVGRNIDCSKTWDDLQHMLEENLSGKKFILGLYSSTTFADPDQEIWDNFTTLLRVGSKGSKIIIVTIDEHRSDMVGTLAPYIIEEPTTLEDKWLVFCDGAPFMTVKGLDLGSGDLVTIGRKLVKECGYSLFMLTTLGYTLGFKTKMEEWRTILNIRKSLHSHPYSTLVTCYHDMEPFLRRCFVYSYLKFGSGSTIQKKKLIQLWMAEGLLEEAATSSSQLAEDVGDAYVRLLDERDFFQYVESGVYCIKISTGFVETLPSRHLFLEKSSSPQGLRDLRVLECTHVKEEYPSFSIIGENRLKHLRYLDLSYGRFKALPDSICKLYHLQTLKLLHCRFLQRLPQGMRKLINLRHLEIEKTLLYIPRGLSQLSNLQTLPWFKMANKEDHAAAASAAGIEELGCLQQLGGSLGLIGLNNVKGREDAKAAKLNEKSRIQELTLEWKSATGADKDSQKRQVDVLEELQPHQNLSLLRMLRFSGTQFPKWLGNNHLWNLQELFIYSCHHVKSLDLTGLRSLRKLEILHCENLECAGINGLKKLMLLEFKRCDKLKSLIGGNQSEVVREEHILTMLTKLRVESCDHLTDLLGKKPLLLQSLESLHIRSYRKQMVLVKNLSSLQDLQIKDCPNLELLDGARQLESLQHFSIGGCPKLKVLLEEIQHWIKLRTLTISACANLRNLPRGIGKLNSLENLEISECHCLFTFSDEIQGLTSLKTLKIEQCPYLTSMPTTMENLSSLVFLEISSCKRLTSLPGGLQDLTSLEILKIKGCDDLEKLPDEMGKGSTLRVLEISGCPSLTLLPHGLGMLHTLSRLEISDCPKLEDLPTTLGDLSSLQFLYIQRCRKLASIPNTLSHMKSLRVLWLIDCASLTDITSGLRCLSSLQKLTIWGCHNLVKLLPPPEGIQKMKSLKELTISNCRKLKMLPNGLEKLSSLKKLVVWECPELKSSEFVIRELRLRGIEPVTKNCPFLEVRPCNIAHATPGCRLDTFAFV